MVLHANKDWYRHVGTQPPPRSNTALTWYKEGAVLFGGMGVNKELLNDTWMWQPTTGWTELPCKVGCASGRLMHSLAAYEITGYETGVIMFGGATTGEPRMDALDDTWQLSSNGTWKQLRLTPHGPNGTTILHAAAPPARWGHSMVAGKPTTTGVFVMLFGGGKTQDDHFGDTWRLEITRNSFQWFQVVPVQTPTTTPALQVPPGRWSYQLAPCGSGVLMATGSTGYRVCTDDTWVWDPKTVPSPWGPSHDQNGTWTVVPQAGANHPGHLGGAGMAAVYGGGLDGVLLFGGIPFEPGTTRIGPLMNETWFFPKTSCP